MNRKNGWLDNWNWDDKSKVLIADSILILKNWMKKHEYCGWNFFIKLFLSRASSTLSFECVETLSHCPRGPSFGFVSQVKKSRNSMDFYWLDPLASLSNAFQWSSLHFHFANKMMKKEEFYIFCRHQNQQDNRFWSTTT